MSCLPEYTCALYVDRELLPDAVREVEAHLIHCQRCRRTILALQEEAGLLAALLQEPDAAPARRAPPRARARGLAMGLGPSLVVAGLVATVAGWLVDQRPPGFSWMNPFDFIGAYEMAFDAIFMLRDAAPAIFDLGIAVGATTGLAALLTFVGTALLRRATGTRAAVFLLAAATASLVLPATRAEALDLRWDQPSVEIARSEALDDNLVASAETVEVDGTVRGDVVAMADRVTIRGVVVGNVFAFGREVLVTGRIDGALHMACEHCSLEGEVTRSLYAAGENVSITETGRVGRDVYLFGEGLRMDGRGGRDLFAGGKWVEVRGELGRSVHTHSERVAVFGEARIGQDLVIAIPENGESEVAPAATIGGDVSESLIEHAMPAHGHGWTDAGFYLRALVFVVSAFLVGMLLHALMPVVFLGQMETSGEFLRCLGYGFVALIVTPVVLVLCAVTVVGIPIAILGGFVYLTLLFVSAIVVAALVGTSITGADPESTHGFGIALLVGLILVAAAGNLPFVGGLLRLLIALAGMGLLVTTAWESWRERRSVPYA